MVQTTIPCNVKFMIEGEEVGGLKTFVENNHES
jgi:hypothetical protein